MLPTRIKERRKQLGMTQAELAQKMGYTDRSTIAKIEKGINGVSIDAILKFSEALQVSTFWLLGLDDPFSSPLSIDKIITWFKTNYIITHDEQSEAKAKQLEYVIESLRKLRDIDETPLE